MNLILQIYEDDLLYRYCFIEIISKLIAQTIINFL